MTPVNAAITLNDAKPTESPKGTTLIPVGASSTASPPDAGSLFACVTFGAESWVTVRLPDTTLLIPLMDAISVTRSAPSVSLIALVKAPDTVPEELDGTVIV